MKRSIGIEVGTNFIRAVMLSKLRGKIKIIKSLQEPWNWKDSQDLPVSLKEILVKGKPAVYLSVPKSLTFFRKASFPFKNRKKILLALPYELEETLSLPAEQLNFDFYVMERSERLPRTLLSLRTRRVKQFHETEIMAIAIPREITKKILTPFEKIGIKISSLESAAISLFNCYFLSLTMKKGNFFILYLSSDEALLNVVKDGLLVDARAIKYQNAIEQEIFYAGKAFFRQESEGIFLAGEENPSLENKLKEKLNLPIIHPNLKSISSLNPEFSLAFALAMRGFIRFPLRVDLRERDKVTFPGRKTILIFSLAMILVLLLLPFFNLKQKEKEHQCLKEEMRKISQSIFPLPQGTSLPVAELKKRLQLSDEGSEEITLLLKKEKSPLESLKRFSALIPQNLKIEVQTMSLDRRKIGVSANLSSLKEIDQLKEILEKSPYFEEIKFGETRLNKEKGTIEFSLNLKIR
ncbi:MAG: hypothetical protein CO162_04465 [bacterium (Candidatus Ratteibacteria) CG_4_9_14_3_um_filter_41_21]|uniref:GspL periplasmic domain-containing protein n=1 Tax=bacterium (Candidatus Ratteibacteria) CG_4_9_14_3_um_filter_41_21 TaxID=2014289 RepID=A0A2M7YFP8_9BACT|nr:MAG: hypothetical protein CO162_04465 [bacterium (Candidatus Ratteibacteria) CG_4_9_14_3_um_filter_41_21]